MLYLDIGVRPSPGAMTLDLGLLGGGGGGTGLGFVACVQGAEVAFEKEGRFEDLGVVAKRASDRDRKGVK